jgi:uncharacterized protein
MVERTIIKIIEQFVDALGKEGIKVDKVILYGSYTQGRQRKYSDIDVAIISRDFGKDPVEEGMRLFRIAGGIDPRIEPVPISLESYEKDTWIPLIYEIRKKGMEVEIAV